MQITKKLIGYLNRVFKKDPLPFLALAISYAGTSFTWSIKDAPVYTAIGTWDDGISTWDETNLNWDDSAVLIPSTTSILTITPIGGSGTTLAIDLSEYTITGLAEFIATQAGYSVSYTNSSGMAALSALVLINGSGSSTQQNGGFLYGYTNFWWAYMDACAEELETARTQIIAMPAQMNTVNANGSWLDFLGNFYGIPRNQGELDPQYGPRIIAMVIRPLGNNIAIAEALRAINGGGAVTVPDYPTLTNNSYGLFDVNFSASLALLSVMTLGEIETSVQAIVNKMRDAGTFLRVLSVISPIEGTTYIGAAVISGCTTYVYPPP